MIKKIIQVNNENKVVNVNEDIKTNTIPWVEKYRPSRFDDIVLDYWNKKILTNIIETRNFPNILFYGPPGTGKTTTIISLIKTYQNYNNEKGNDLVIHLNASDDRGIDIIRNQIQQFVSSKSLFGNGIKFVILDEVDYMTKNAQQALKNLITNYKNVRFCLICNYISRIEKCLQDECMNMRFNQLPKDDIIQFLKNIIIQEQLHYTDSQISYIQNYYKSDIRSMINYIQTNQNNSKNYKLFDNNITKECFNKIIKIEKLEIFIDYIHNLSLIYNIHKKEILLKLIYYIIDNCDLLIFHKSNNKDNDDECCCDLNGKFENNLSTNEKYALIECFIYIIHIENICEIHNILSYFWYKLKLSFSSSISK